MDKKESRIQNLQKMIQDIEAKIERLQAQKQVYELALSSLQKDQ